MYSAQAQLADAYIAAGAAAEARYIAEDLVAREPWEKANVERFRRALVLLGEPDPDALIAERLSGQSPFTSTDLSFSDLPSGGEQKAAAPAPPPAAPSPEPVHASAQKNQKEPRAQPPEPEPEPQKTPAPAAKRAGAKGKVRHEEASHFELSSNAIDLDSILGGFEKSARKQEPVEEEKLETAEIDLSVVLDDIKPSGARAGGPSPGQPDDLDSVFAQLREKASKQVDAAEAQYKKGLALRDAGRIDEAMKALQEASRAPRLRFQTASLLARMYRERKALPQAIEWYERAAEAPAPTAEEGHLLLYELADVLESTGEVARALAICLELQADIGDYRDVSKRIDRLSKVQTRG